MIQILSVGLMMVLAILFIPVSVLLVQVLCALAPRRPVPLPNTRRARIAVLIPAHNESGGIKETLDFISPQLNDGDRVVVVADNCSDTTAEVARASGAEVVERTDISLRGKSYALEFGAQYLARDPPEIVVFVDADCEVKAGSIDRIVHLSESTGRPVQALYLMKSPAAAGPMSPISEFAVLVKNLVRPLGSLRLGLPCQLIGSGMAVPWVALSSIKLASGHIVEDMKMGIDLARNGTPPLFCPDSLVLSYFPSAADGAIGQRTRWEHGHLAMIGSEAPRMFMDALRGRGSGLAPLAFDMCVPPLSLLLILVVALFGISAVHASLTSVATPFILAALILLMLIVSISLAWLRFGRNVVSLSRLLLASVYALRKIPLYIKFIVSRQVEWVRAKRDTE